METSLTRQSDQVVGDYELQRKIGEGAFGSIFKSRGRNNHNTYAVKVIPVGFDGAGNNSTISEAKILS
jgi:NIMA (never in mitosis gene a)-related kinase 7